MHFTDNTNYNENMINYTARRNLFYPCRNNYNSAWLWSLLLDNSYNYKKKCTMWENNIQKYINFSNLT